MSEGKSVSTEALGFAENAYVRLAPELATLTDDDLIPVNVDPDSSAGIALGCLPHIKPLTAQLEHEFRQFKPALFERLADCAWCLRHTNILYLAATCDEGCPPEVFAQGQYLRRLLANEAKLLASRGLLQAARLRGLTMLNGYSSLAMDLAILVNVYRDAWPTLDGKCAVPRRELEEAEGLSERFVWVASRREKTPQNVAKAVDTRQRAFSLLYLNYERLRSWVTCLRWLRGDADAFMPSLFVKRGSRARKQTSSATSHAAPANGSPTEQLIEMPTDKNVNES